MILPDLTDDDVLPPLEDDADEIADLFRLGDPIPPDRGGFD